MPAPKDRERMSAPLAGAALLEPFVVGEPPNGRMAWWREWATRVLALGAYGENLGDPGRLHPKSPAWRQLVELARPLTRNERANLELLVAGNTEGLVFVSGDLHDRLHAPERHDAARFRAQDAGRLRGSRKAADKRGPGPAKIREVYARRFRATPRASHPALCAEVSRELDVKLKTVQNVVPRSSRTDLT